MKKDIIRFKGRILLVLAIGVSLDFPCSDDLRWNDHEEFKPKELK